MQIVSRRKPIFWLCQAIGVLLIILTCYLLSLSLVSVICGIFVAYINMELVIRMLQPRLFFIIFKYIILFSFLYVLIPYLDGMSFILGISGMLFYLMGLCVEVFKYDSL